MTSAFPGSNGNAATDPVASLNFDVRVDDDKVHLGSFTSCEGLGIETQVISYEEGGQMGTVYQLPGRMKYTNVKLSRPLAPDSNAASWFAQFDPKKRVTATIRAMSPVGFGRECIAQWSLDGVFPVRWTGPQFKVDGGAIANETLELALSGFGFSHASIVATPNVNQVTKARITPVTGGGQALECVFNPKEVKLSTGADWKRQPVPSSPNAPAAQFRGTQARTLTIDLLFDANFRLTKTGRQLGRNVARDIKTLMDWTNPTSQSRGSTTPNPPMLKFEWGSSSFATFVAYLKSVSVNFSLFDGSGNPLRANAGCTFEEVPDVPENQNPTSGGRAGRRTHVLRAGDSLHSIAQHEYGKPAYWRGLAALNGIDDPLRIPVGTTILVPPSEDVKARS
jgi:phage tail-like protein